MGASGFPADTTMPPLPPHKQILGLIVWLLVTFSASAIGTLASVRAKAFYAELSQPLWAPPAWVFGPVWTLLFGLMAVAAWWVWRAGGFGVHRGALGLFLLQLGVNALWSWLFFAWQLGLWALLDITVLLPLILATLIAFWRVRPLAGLLLVPYLLWVMFAAGLNYALWQLNPELLG